MIYTKNKTYPNKTGVVRFGQWKGLTVKTFVGSSTGFGQYPISDVPLAYNLTKAMCWDPPISNVGADNSYAAVVIGSGALASFKTTAQNKAYDRFVSQINETTANLALNLVEWEKSTVMIVQRAGQLLRAARALRKGKFKQFTKALGVKAKRSDEKLRWVRKHQTFRRPVPAKQPFWNKRRAKFENVSPANVWLEYNFGWKPLLQDMYASCKILSSNVPAVTARGRGKSWYTLPPAFSDASYPKQVVIGEVRVLMQAKIRISNPNLLLLNQAGLINPAHVIWDAVPFSFVIDWFYPLGKYIRSWSDFLGIDFINPFTTVTYRAADSGQGTGLNAVYTRNSVAWKITRSIGTQAFKYTPVARLNWDWWKSATTISLLIQQLGSLGLIDSVTMAPRKRS